MTYLIEPSVDQSFTSQERAPIDVSSLSAVERGLLTEFSRANQIIYQETLDHEFWERSIIVKESELSQFDALVNLARSADPPSDSLACLALTGSKFHGNRGRKWMALPGNLHFSSYCRLNLDAARCGPALSMLPTVAVTDVIAHLRGSQNIHPCWIKWVNDVCLGDEKLSGSLVSSQVDGDTIVSCVLGIGINLEIAPDLEGESSFGGATSLRQHGVASTVPGAFELLLEALARRIEQLSTADGPDELFMDYRSRIGGIGRQIQVLPAQDETCDGDTIIASGCLLDVRPDLSLEIQGENRVRSGRLRFTETSQRL